MAYKKFSDFEEFTEPDITDYLVGYRELANEYKTRVEDFVKVVKNASVPTVPNTIFVNVSGDDSFDGNSEFSAVRTIKRAFAIALGRSRDISPDDAFLEETEEAWGTRSIPVNVFVRSGDYVEDNPIYIPPSCTLIGEDFRSTNIIPKNRFYDIFWVNNKNHLYNVTYHNHLMPSYAVAYPEMAWLNNEPVVGYPDTRVREATAKAFNFYTSAPITFPATKKQKSSDFNYTIDEGEPIFDPFKICFLDRYFKDINENFYTNEEILQNKQFWETEWFNLSTSVQKPYQSIPPYIHDSSSITRSLSVGELLNAGGGILVDGYKVRGTLRSIFADSFTLLNEGGKGVHVKNNGYAQLISTFTICCLDGVFCESGGSCSISNSNSTFGLSGLVALGKSPKNTLRGTLKEAISNSTNIFVITNLGNPEFSTSQEFPDDVQPYPGQIFEIIDKNYLRSDAPGINYLSATNGGSFFTVLCATPVKPAEAPYVGWESTIVLDRDYNYTEDSSVFGEGITYIDPVIEGLSIGSDVNFYIRSTIMASSHTFEHVGTGTELSKAIPQKGGVGKVENEVVFDDVGKVYFTSINQLGKFKIGRGLTIDQTNRILEGETLTGLIGKLTIVGNISGNNLRVSFNQGVAMGTKSFASGTGLASGSYSTAQGFNTIASGQASRADGYNTIASGNNSHAEGDTTIASGFASHSEGALTIAAGGLSGYTHAEGFQTQALSAYSHAEGFNSIASGIASHAEGKSTQASGNYSHAEGDGTTASGIASHAEGDNTIASGDFGHAGGNRTRARGVVSHATGIYSEAVHDRTWLWKGSTSTIYLSTTRADQFMVSADGGSAFFGNVGIGTDSLDNALTINGNVSSSQVVYSHELDFGSLERPSLTGVKQALNSFLYVTPALSYVRINGSSSQTLEVGQALTAPTITWDSNKVEPQAITQYVLTLGNGISSTGGFTFSSFNDPNTYNTITIGGTSTQQTSSWSVLVTDWNGAQATGTASANWRYRVYFGTTSSSTPNSTNILNGVASEANRPLAISRLGLGAKTVSPSNQYFYIAYPQRFGTTSTLRVNGLNYNDFTQQSIETFTNASGGTDSYYVYRSNNLLTAVYTIEII
jgi:hypothetical protein